MINIENVSKSFGGQKLLAGVSFQLGSRERVGVVGRNGHGKTTLFRMILGESESDKGAIHIPRHYQISHVSQQLRFTRKTILEEGMTGLPEADASHQWKVEKILAGLGFSASDMSRHPSKFSGGYQVRLNLTKALVSEPDLLLLDEPTNYLDITSIRWIEKFLLSWPTELMLITHDRSFMDKVVTHILGIHRHKLRKVTGNTEKYYMQIAQDEEVYEKTRLNDEKRKKEIDLFISRFRAKARLANMVQSRVKTLAKMEKRHKLETIKSLEFSFRYQPFPAKTMLRAENLTFGYNPGEPLIQDFSIIIGAGERVCVIGPNGRGKTTLLKLLSGGLFAPNGDVTYHPGAELGIYEQTNISTLVEERTVEEEILYAGGRTDRQHARNICGAMMFEGDTALKKVGILSGGEKCRVMMGKLLAQPTNILLLDEPSNHLDMDACDALLAALDGFPGAVIMVTHNELFLHALAQKLVVFQDGDVEMFDGTYQRFLEKGGWDRQRDAEPPARQGSDGSPGGDKLNKKQLRQRRSPIIAERARLLKPLERQMAESEDKIKKKKKKIGELNQEMLAVS
ncbi:MAG: ABC-F family ATP-binding cassette domain-containing protein, partial [Deltaproteobacteria bacterium]|nr:ABC-F family ATP-binding cassette domain-containing protein [Deltaproteobacteria bacterium]